MSEWLPSCRAASAGAGVDHVDPQVAFSRSLVAQCSRLHRGFGSAAAPGVVSDRLSSRGSTRTAVGVGAVQPMAITKELMREKSNGGVARPRWLSVDQRLRGDLICRWRRRFFARPCSPSREVPAGLEASSSDAPDAKRTTVSPGSQWFADNGSCELRLSLLAWWSRFLALRKTRSCRPRRAAHQWPSITFRDDLLRL